MSKQVDVGVRAAVMRELSAIRDLDTFLERTATNRSELCQEIATLKQSIQKLRTEAQQTALTTQQRLNEDTHEIEQACLELAGAILLKRPIQLVAGPLLLWENGEVYAIVSRGGVPMLIQRVHGGCIFDLFRPSLGVSNPLLRKSINQSTILKKPRMPCSVLTEIFAWLTTRRSTSRSRI